ncbi:hypothetical protein LINPERPRIM_LOCUS16127 [Linum perenne]
MEFTAAQLSLYNATASSNPINVAIKTTECSTPPLAIPSTAPAVPTPCSPAKMTRTTPMLYPSSPHPLRQEDFLPYILTKLRT